MRPLLTRTVGKRRFVEHQVDANPKAPRVADRNIAQKRVVDVGDPEARRLVVQKLQTHARTGAVGATREKKRAWNTIRERERERDENSTPNHTAFVVVGADADGNRGHGQVVDKLIQHFGAVFQIHAVSSYVESHCQTK